MKEKVVVPGGPAPVGPYSPAVRAAGMIFASGQIPIDPASGRLVEGDLQAEVRQTLENLKSVLEAAGSSLEKAVKCTVYLEDMGDFAAMNEVYSAYFGGQTPPARVCIQAARLPKGVRVEIDAIALA